MRQINYTLEEIGNHYLSWLNRLFIQVYEDNVSGRISCSHVFTLLRSALNKHPLDV